MHYYYIISLKNLTWNNKCSNKAECDNRISLKVTNQTHPSIKNWDIDCSLEEQRTRSAQGEKEADRENQIICKHCKCVLCVNYVLLHVNIVSVYSV